MYLACPTNPLKGPELNTLNLTWVHSSILWQYFLSYANILKKKKKKDTTSKVSVVPLLISINFDQEREQLKEDKPRLFKICESMAQFILTILIRCMHRANGANT